MQNQPKLIFIDTEFTDFLNTDLISLGCIDEAGEKRFYVEITDYNKKASSEFVRMVVEPLLDPVSFGKSTAEAAAAFSVWLDEFECPVILCYDYPTDYTLVLNLLDEIKPVNLEGGILVWDLLRQYWKHECDLYKNLQTQSKQNPYLDSYFNRFTEEYFGDNPGKRRHHALHDAMSNQWAHQKVHAMLMAPRNKGHQHEQI